VRRLDNFLKRLGLMRTSQQAIRRMDYDFATGEIHVELGNGGWQNRIRGFVCPTPDGPLKKILNTTWLDEVK
jgi:hypothetical protein